MHTGNGDGSTLKHPQVASLTTAGSRTSDEDHLMPLNMSPASWQSSPGTSPPTSPALTPRGTRWGLWCMYTSGAKGKRERERETRNLSYPHLN